MNFVILCDENCIYTCNKNGMQIEFYNLQQLLQVQLKIVWSLKNLDTLCTIQSLEFQEKGSILADSL